VIKATAAALIEVFVRHPLRILLIVVVAIVLASAVALIFLRVINPPTTPFMIRASVHLHQVHPDQSIAQHWVGFDAIADCMPLAVVAAEDQTFPDNFGFDWGAIKQAFLHNANSGIVHGASTLTQQTAKNLFLWPARTWLRKGIEAYITLWMDLLWSKRRILAVYLNIAQFSKTAFGVQAAAQQLFHTDAKRLTRNQCAALAAVLPAPDKYNAAHPGRYVAHRKAWILRQMRNLGPHYLDGILGQD
jgi:monofunctional biosynthetic peptidoglycan transglycosylase